MLCLKNELGWRIEKLMGIYTIRMPNPSRLQIMQLSPVLINVMLFVCLWIGRDPATRVILCAIAGLLLLWLMARGRFRHYIPHFITGLLIFVSLIVRSDITIGPVLFSIPLTLLFGLWAFRPFVLSVNPRMRLVVLGDLVTKIPFSKLKIDVDFSSQTSKYKVFLRNTEQTKTDSLFGIDRLECLAWESNSETEANQIVEQLRTLGIEEDNAIQKDKLVHADRKACTLFITAHIMSVVILVLLLFYMAHHNDYTIEDNLHELFRFIKIIIAFFFLSVIPFAVYLGRLGWRAVRYRHMPPPVTTVLTDTKVLEGDAAVKRGKLLIVVGIVLLAISLICGLILPYAFGEMYLGSLPG